VTLERSDWERWAKIPESLIVGELLDGIDSRERGSAVVLYCYLDLRQGADGWPVKGFRAVARKLGYQDRTVSSAAKILHEAGLIELTLTQPVATSAVMKVIHNPARRRVNPSVTLRSPPKRYRHDALPYTPSVRESHTTVRESHAATSIPDAPDATGSRSIRSEWFDAETRDALAKLVTDDPRCSNCLGLVEQKRERSTERSENCDCPFVATSS